MKPKRRKYTSQNREQAEKRPLVERMGNFLDVPADLLSGGCYLELRGRSELHLQGCRKILIYTTEEIVLRLRRGVIRVRGRKLICTSYHAGTVEIGGWIAGIDFPDGQEDAFGGEAGMGE